MKRVCAATIGFLFLFLSLALNTRPSLSQDLFNFQILKQAHAKLEASLYEMVLSYRDGGLAAATDYAARTAITLKQEYVQVILEVEDSDVFLEPTIRGFGGRIEATYEDLIQVSAPLWALEAIASIDSVKFIRRPFIPVPTVISEGVSKIGADVWQAAGYRGNGVKVAIVDLGFQGYLRSDSGS